MRPEAPTVPCTHGATTGIRHAATHSGQTHLTRPLRPWAHSHTAHPGAGHSTWQATCGSGWPTGSPRTTTQHHPRARRQAPAPAAIALCAAVRGGAPASCVALSPVASAHRTLEATLPASAALPISRQHHRSRYPRSRGPTCGDTQAVLSHPSPCSAWATEGGTRPCVPPRRSGSTPPAVRSGYGHREQ